MNERPRNDGEHSRLSPEEVKWLIKRAKREGVSTDADYSDIQPKERPLPQFYILELDASIVQRHKAEHGATLEEVRGAMLEYDDPRVLYKDGPVLPAKLAITIESYIYNDVDPSVVYLKDVVYTLMIKPDAQWEVMESYYDLTTEGYSLVNRELVGTGEEKVDDTRALNEEDVSLLHLFI